MKTLNGNRTAVKRWTVKWTVKHADKSSAKCETNANNWQNCTDIDNVKSIIQRDTSDRLNKRSVDATKQKKKNNQIQMEISIYQVQLRYNYWSSLLEIVSIALLL